MTLGLKPRTMLKNVPLLLVLAASLACAQTTNIAIQNPGFETATLPLPASWGFYNNLLIGAGTCQGWVAVSNAASGSIAGVGSPTAQAGKWWDGQNLALILNVGPGTSALGQTLPAVLQNNTTYTLSAAVGGQPPVFSSNYAIQLWAGNVLLASTSKYQGAQSIFAEIDSVTFSSGPNHPQAGQPLSIALSSGTPAGQTSNVNFDDVTLTAAPTSAAAISSVFSAGAFGGFSSASPGSWIEIYGTNLASDTRLWAGSDFSGINAPTSLDGTKITVGGKSAFIDYISPGQVNALIPSDTPTGVQSLTVTSPAGGSTAYSLTVNAVQPGLLAPPNFKIGNSQYAVAIFADGTYALPTGAVPGVNSRPAKAGDTITLYGVGFGPVTPSIPAGQLAQQLNTIAIPLLVNIGGVPAPLGYDGLAPGYTGLYQFNVTIPSLPAGDAALTFTLGGTAGTQTLYLPIAN